MKVLKRNATQVPPDLLNFEMLLNINGHYNIL